MMQSLFKLISVVSDKFASIGGSCLQAMLGVMRRENPELLVNRLLRTKIRSQYYARELGLYHTRECLQTHQIPGTCHSERSEESILSLAIWPSVPWILRSAQDDKPGLKTPPGAARLLRKAISASLGLFLVCASSASVSFEESARSAHAMLTRLCDDFGGRHTGSTNNHGAMNQLVGELRALGLKPDLVPFKMSGWERGADQVSLIEPFARSLRVAAVEYSQPHAPFEADVVDIGVGQPTNYPVDVRGKIALLDPASAQSARNIVRMAAEKGIRGVLYINREAGGQLLARTGSFMGEPLPVPMYSLNQEEGRWMQRLLARGRKVRVRMETKSRCVDVETANLVLTLPGHSPERVIVGAHFDSEDLGQGALDNGLGTAQLFAFASALRGQTLARTVELVWFNGEEQGLWGSRYQSQHLGDAGVVAMINLDMVGVPIAVNALGDESLVPVLERWNAARGTHKLPRGVENINWFGSDHTPYQLAGVRTVTFNAPIPRESVRYYHDFADTIDKLPEQILVDSTAVIGDLVVTIAGDAQLTAFRRTAEETEKLFTRFGLERRMQGIGYWPFPVTPVLNNSK
jgi:Iap family predicted aminopeptidase